MDGYQFVAAILASLVSLAWPTAFVAAVWLFREELRKLLPSFYVKHKDWEAAFRLNRAEEEAKSLPSPVESPETKETPEERDQFMRISKISPRAGILELRAALEGVLIETALRLRGLDSSDENMRMMTARSAARLLRNKSAIEASMSAIIDDLLAIGNSAAHRHDVEFTYEDAVRYSALANQVVYHLGYVEKRP